MSVREIQGHLKELYHTAPFRRKISQLYGFFPLLLFSQLLVRHAVSAKKGELSPLAYILYMLLLSKAVLITAMFERDPKGALKILKGALHGMRGEFTPFFPR